MNSYKRLITLYNDKTIYFKIKQSLILGIVYKCTQTKLSDIEKRHHSEIIPNKITLMVVKLCHL